MAGNDVYKLIYLLVNDVYMAKLYWRIKRNGKWTWQAATVHDTGQGLILVDRLSLQEDEE